MSAETQSIAFLLFLCDWALVVQLVWFHAWLHKGVQVWLRPADCRLQGCSINGASRHSHPSLLASRNVSKHSHSVLQIALTATAAPPCIQAGCMNRVHCIAALA